MERGDKDLAKSEAEKASTEDAIASSEAAIEEMTASSESLAEEVPLLRYELREMRWFTGFGEQCCSSAL